MKIDEERNAIKTMIEVMTDCVQQIIAKAHYDQTITAKVVEYVNPKKCKVLRNGKTYVCAIYMAYEVGDIVIVCIPCNNKNASFVVVNCSR